MSEVHDSWIQEAFGVDVGDSLDKIKEAASATLDQVKSTVTEAVAGVEGAVEGAVDGIATGVVGVVKKAAGAVSPSAPAVAARAGGGSGAFPLGGSVGRGGKNAVADVSAVQSALGITADGQCGAQTIAAIEAFQKSVGQAKPDGRVDAGGATERALSGGGSASPTASSADPSAPGLLDDAIQGAQALGGKVIAEAKDDVGAAVAAGGKVLRAIGDEADDAAGVATTLGGGIASGGATADITSAPGAVAYQPGEREASFSSPGGVEKTGSGFVLFNFGVDKTFIKPEHQKLLTDLVNTLHLDDPGSQTSIIKVSGFTDGVDTEPKNSPLRANRADAVQIFLLGKGATEENVGAAIGTPAGTFLAPNTTPEGRARNRAVVIEFGSLLIDPVPDPVAPAAKSTKATRWALQSNLSFSPPAKPGVAITTANFILHDLENKKKHLLEFTGFGGGFGVSFPASVSLPSPAEFQTTVPRDVAEFNGGGAIRSGSVGIGIGFAIGEAQLHVSTIPPQIDIGGFQFSFGVEASFVGGQWKVLD